MALRKGLEIRGKFGRTIRHKFGAKMRGKFGCIQLVVNFAMNLVVYLAVYNSP